MVRTKGPVEFRGKTNREAARSGKPPELKDGSFINLHHINQDSRGALVEASGKVHKKYHKPLHNQFKGGKHPEYPVDHGKNWQSDVKEYWKGRVD